MRTEAPTRGRCPLDHGGGSWGASLRPTEGYLEGALRCGRTHFAPARPPASSGARPAFASRSTGAYASNPSASEGETPMAGRSFSAPRGVAVLTAAACAFVAGRLVTTSPAERGLLERARAEDEK